MCVIQLALCGSVTGTSQQNGNSHQLPRPLIVNGIWTSVVIQEVVVSNTLLEWTVFHCLSVSRS